MAKKPLGVMLAPDVVEDLEGFRNYGFPSRNQMIEACVRQFIQQQNAPENDTDFERKVRSVMRSELEERFGHLMEDGRTINGRALTELVRANPFQERVNAAVHQTVKDLLNALYQVDESYAIHADCRTVRIALNEALRRTGIDVDAEMEEEQEDFEP